jgi:hypothetical protein
VILPEDRDPRLITIRRGGTLTDSDHRLLALWAAACAEHVLHLFGSVQPFDPPPRQAIEQIRAWARGEIRMSRSRAAGGPAMTAARVLSGAARHAAFAAGQAGAVAHVAAHELGAAAYAIKAVRAAAPGGQAEGAGRLECRWQCEPLPLRGDSPVGFVDPLGLERGNDGCGLLGLGCAWDWIMENKYRFGTDVLSCLTNGFELGLAASVPAPAGAPSPGLSLDAREAYGPTR